jgi:hypothetical protein
MDPFVIESAVAIQVFDLEWVQKFVLLLSQECEEGATDAVVENLIEEILERELHAMTNVNLNEQEEDDKMVVNEDFEEESLPCENGEPFSELESAVVTSATDDVHLDFSSAVGTSFLFGDEETGTAIDYESESDDFFKDYVLGDYHFYSTVLCRLKIECNHESKLCVIVPETRAAVESAMLRGERELSANSAMRLEEKFKKNFGSLMVEMLYWYGFTPQKLTLPDNEVASEEKFVKFLVTLRMFGG